MHILASLGPVFAIIALGFLLRRGGFLTPELSRGTSRLAYWVGMPCLLFREIARSRLDLLEHSDAFGILVLAVIVCVACGFAGARLLGAPPGAGGTLAQASFRGNLAFVGFPVVIYSTPGADAPIVATAVVLLAATVPLYNAAAVAVLVASRPGGDGAFVRRAILPILTNPLIIACLAGGVPALAGWSLPLALDRTLMALGRMALPLALLGVGAGLQPEKIVGAHSRLVVYSSLVKVALAPSLGWLAGRWAGLSSDELRVVCTFLAAPTAAVSYILAEQLDGHPALAAGAVAASALMATVSLSVVVGLL